MCNFKSAIVTRNGKLLHNAFLDSHEDIVDLFNLHDNGMDNFVKVEFIPHGKFWEIDNYKFKINEYDEYKVPSWWTKELEEKTIQNLTKIIKNMIFSGKRKILVGGKYILYNAEINKIANCVIQTMDNSQVNEMWGNSQVNEMWGNSQVNEMWGNSQVNEMLDNSQVNKMWDNSQVNKMLDNSQVNEMLDNSQVNEMLGNSQVNEMWGNSQVNKMLDNSQVNEMWGNSRIVVDKRFKK